MTYKLLKANGCIVHRSSLHHLTDAKKASKTHRQLRNEFDDGIRDRLGPGATMEDFEPDELTPVLEYYEDDEDGFEGTPDDMPEQTVTPE